RGEVESRSVGRGRGEVGRSKIVIVGRRGEEKSPDKERGGRGSTERGGGALRIDEDGRRSGGTVSRGENESGRVEETKSVSRIRIEGRGSGRGEVESRRRGEVESRGRGEVESRGRGEVERF